MQKLWLASGAALAVLCGLLIGVLTLVEVFTKLPFAWTGYTVGIALAIVLAQFLLAPIIIPRIFKIRWCDPAEISPEFAEWYTKTAGELRIGHPRFGIIANGMPNAFTVGRVVRDARVVVTKGLLDTLKPDEVEAVVAHEFGHIRNRDFIAMTLVQSMVLIIYYGARVLLRNNDFKAKAAGAVAYGVYWLAQLGALAFSRLREFMADRTSAESIHNPDALATALVKIGYGLAHYKEAFDEVAKRAAKEKKKGSKAKPAFSGALGAWGIAPIAAFGAVAHWVGEDNEISPTKFLRVSAWDLKNPWATYGEILSTHPLIVRRVNALMALPESRRTFPVTKFDRRNWGRFGREWLVYALPTIAMLVVWLGLISREITNPIMLSGGLCALFAALMVRLTLVYPRSQFADATVIDLLSDTESSHVSPIPCTLRGKFVSRAEGGLAWSANLVFQDESGLLFAQRKLFMPAFLTAWGSGKSKTFVGEQDVVVTGWFRRFGHPCLEIRSIACAETGQVFRSQYWVRSMIALAVLLGVSGIVLLFALFG